jgi:hypothetical protein
MLTAMTTPRIAMTTISSIIEKPLPVEAACGRVLSL